MVVIKILWVFCSPLGMQFSVHICLSPDENVGLLKKMGFQEGEFLFHAQRKISRGRPTFWAMENTKDAWKYLGSETVFLTIIVTFRKKTYNAS